MSSINKHQVMQEWVSDFLTDNYLYFESADAYPDTRVIVPQYGDYVLRTDICGFKYKQYTFAFIGYERLDTGTSDVNSYNMGLFDSFIEWLETQEENKNYPDFGTNCSDYKVVILQDMANLATVFNDGLAKYMLVARIEYKEV